MKFAYLLKRAAIAVGGLSLGLVLAPAHAATTFSLSSGSVCGGPTSASFTPGAGNITVSLCATTGAGEPFCGASIKLLSAAGQGGLFNITNRTLGPALPDPTTASPTYPIAISNPAAGPDLGGTPNGTASTAGGLTTLLATFTITPPASAPLASYVITTDAFTSLSTPSPDCTTPGDPVGVPTQASFTLNKIVTPATAVFTIAGPVNVTEAGATANAVVTCTGALDGNNTAITVPFTTTNAAGNFTTSASPVTFTACAGATQNIVVSPRVDDAIVQGPVSGTIVLGTPSAGSLGATTTATVNVADNDTPPVFGLVKAGACAEPTTSCTFTVVRESGITNNTAVGFTISGTATRGTDYTLNDTGCGGPVISGNSVTHTQAAPSGGFTIAVCPIDDTAVEGAETVIMTLNTGAGYTLGAVATQTQSIADDDSPQVVTVAVNGPVSEAGGVLTYTFTRSGGSAAAQAATLSVNTTAPATSSRYSTTCGASITFAASTSTATCTVTAIDNVAVDGNATATVAVAAPTVAGAYTVGSPSSATGTINDDDVAVNAVAGNTGSAASMGITEGAVARFSVSCPTLAAPFTVNYSIAPATPATGDVFVGGGATGSVTCPAAAASLVAVPTTVQTLDDSLIGNARTYTMTISVPAVPGPAPAATVIGNAVATVVVADNDQPTSIPTMGAAGLGLLSLMLAGLAAFQRRRRA